MRFSHSFKVQFEKLTSTDKTVRRSLTASQTYREVLLSLDKLFRACCVCRPLVEKHCACRRNCPSSTPFRYNNVCCVSCRRVAVGTPARRRSDVCVSTQRPCRCYSFVVIGENVATRMSNEITSTSAAFFEPCLGWRVVRCASHYFQFPFVHSFSTDSGTTDEHRVTLSRDMSLSQWCGLQTDASVVTILDDRWWSARVR
jgi:hypothetical protein